MQRANHLANTLIQLVYRAIQAIQASVADSSAQWIAIYSQIIFVKRKNEAKISLIIYEIKEERIISKIPKLQTITLSYFP